MADSDEATVPASDPCVRVAGTPAALSAAKWPGHERVLPIAPDEVLVFGAAPADVAAAVQRHDEWAIVVADHGWSSVSMSPEAFRELMARHSEWPPPATGFAQGAIAGIAAKVWVADPVIVTVPAATAADFAARIGAALTGGTR